MKTVEDIERPTERLLRSRRTGQAGKRVKRNLARVALAPRDAELLVEALEVLYGHRGEAARLYLMEYVAIWKKACSLRRRALSGTNSDCSKFAASRVR